jgi:hypothetical protein
MVWTASCRNDSCHIHKIANIITAYQIQDCHWFGGSFGVGVLLSD